MATGAPSPRHPAVPIRYRPSVSDLTPDQLQRLRAAFDAVRELDDDRGYQYFAGLHGLPLPSWCDRYGHGKPTFLHWHRAYLYRFELALQAAVNDPTVMVPWWDWRTERQVPEAYDEEGPDNPLFSVRINDEALQQGARGRPDDVATALAGFPDTFREPGRPGTHLPTTDEVEEILDQDFWTFNSNLEDFHGDVHVWVGGHMGAVPFAAYDPIFFAHHAMVDRIWRMWQLRHPSDDSMPATLKDQVMQPFHLTAGRTLDPTILGYDYAVSAIEVPVA